MPRHTSYAAPTRIRVRLLRFGLILVGITFSGTIGFMLLEGWQVIDALYMTVITLSTVGFSEVSPLSAEGRLFTTALIVSGVASVGYLFSAISKNIVSGKLHGTLRRRRMQKSVGHLAHQARRRADSTGYDGSTTSARNTHQELMPNKIT